MVLLFSDGGVRIATATLGEEEVKKKRVTQVYVSEAHCIRNLTLLGI